MRMSVPVTMFGSVPTPSFVHERCIGKGLYHLLYWSQYIGYVFSSSCFFLLFLVVVSPDKCGEGLVIFPCFVSGMC